VRQVSADLLGIGVLGGVWYFTARDFWAFALPAGGRVLVCISLHYGASIADIIGEVEILTRSCRM
jgi:hypothetical protein